VPAGDRPIVTLTTDFGTRDHYVAAMKAVLLRYCPDVCLIDVTHEVPRHDILCGSITLERAVDGFPPETVHLAVVDPGVGTNRRILIAQINQQRVVCPDNGLITWAWRRLGHIAPSPGTPGEGWGEGLNSVNQSDSHLENPHPNPLPEYRARGKSPPIQHLLESTRVYELKWRPRSSSHTFHGRDVMAPAAGMIAMGAPLEKIAEPIDDPILLDVYPASPGSTTARIIHIDVFGNATTNMDRSTLQSPDERTFAVKGRHLGRLHRTYWDAPPGEALALVGSSGLLEIAVRDGSAADQLDLHVGDIVTIE